MTLENVRGKVSDGNWAVHYTRLVEYQNGTRSRLADLVEYFWHKKEALSWMQENEGSTAT